MSPDDELIFRFEALQKSMRLELGEALPFCANCSGWKGEHAGDKCLFKPTRFELGAYVYAELQPGNEYGDQYIIVQRITTPPRGNKP